MLSPLVEILLWLQSTMAKGARQRISAHRMAAVKNRVERLS